MKKILNFIYFLYFDYLLKRKGRSPVKKGTLLLIKLDSIGDYILFRNFLPYLKNKYSGYKITYCGTIEVKDLVSTFDSEIFHDYIWIDRLKFLTDSKYKEDKLTDIHNRGYEIVISPNYTREILFADQIVKVSDAEQRIGSLPSPDKSKRMNLLTDSFYTELIDASEKNQFEFYRNKNFFEKLLGVSLDIKRTELTPLQSSKEFNLKNHILLFPGAKEPKRRWSPDYFAELSDYIIKNSDYKIALTGSAADKEISERIINKTVKDKITDLTGVTSLPDLVKVISECELLISNETGAIHIAAALQVPFICISNGNHYGRFNPYPAEIFDKGYFIYPPEFEKHDEEKLRFNSELDINSIKVKEVTDLFIKLEKEKFGRTIL